MAQDAVDLLLAALPEQLLILNKLVKVDLKAAFKRLPPSVDQRWLCYALVWAMLCCGHLWREVLLLHEWQAVLHITSVCSASLFLTDKPPGPLPPSVSC